MDNLQMYIVLAITAFMALGFVLNKWPFGLTAMTCCILLVVTKVFTIEEAFSGFANQTTLLIASMMVLGSSITKTSLVNKINGKMREMKNTHGMMLVFCIFVMGIIFVQFVPAVATIAIMVTFLETLGNDGELTPKRLLLPLLGVSAAWKGVIPIGSMSATYMSSINGLIASIVGEGIYEVSMMDLFKVYVGPSVIMLVYCMFAWRLMPKDNNEIDKSSLKGMKENAAIPKWQENVIYLVFVLVMAALLLNKFTGKLMYIVPAIGVVILAYTRVMSIQEIVGNLTKDLVWMIAGTLTVASAIGQSGASALIGNALLNVIGENTNSFVIMLIFTYGTLIMTSFIANIATMNMLIPIAASVGMAGNFDPRGIAMCITLASMLAVVFPSGSVDCACTFAAGSYNPAKVARFTVPYVIIAGLVLAASANMFFPIYG